MRILQACERTNLKERYKPFQKLASRPFRVAAWNLVRIFRHRFQTTNRKPLRGGASGFVAFGLFEQRHSYPSSGCKEKEEIGCCDSTVTHRASINDSVFLSNKMRGRPAAAGRPYSSLENREFSGYRKLPPPRFGLGVEPHPPTIIFGRESAFGSFFSPDSAGFSVLPSGIRLVGESSDSPIRFILLGVNCKERKSVGAFRPGFLRFQNKNRPYLTIKKLCDKGDL